MKKKMSVMFCILMLMVGVAFAEEPQHRSTITVQGNASVTAQPDIVTITANAGVTGSSMLDAQEKVGGIVAAATGKLIELGVQEADIVTANYSYYPEYSYEETGRRLTGYSAGHTLEITCRDIEMLDAVITAVTDSGMSEIYSVEYGLSSRTALYSEALALAIRAAEEKALTMASASGQTLTALVSVTENSGFDARCAVTAAKGLAMDNAAEEISTGIRSGSVSVSAGVTAVYEAVK